MTVQVERESGFGIQAWDRLAALFDSQVVAAITTAIRTGEDAHEDSTKHYIAGIACDMFYIVVGIFGVTLAALF